MKRLLDLLKFRSVGEASVAILWRLFFGFVTVWSWSLLRWLLLHWGDGPRFELQVQFDWAVAEGLWVWSIFVALIFMLARSITPHGELTSAEGVILGTWLGWGINVAIAGGIIDLPIIALLGLGLHIWAAVVGVIVLILGGQPGRAVGQLLLGEIIGVAVQMAVWWLVKLI